MDHVKTLLKAGACVFFALVGWNQYMEYRAAKNWPSVNGTINGIRVESHTNTRSNDNGLRRTETRYEVKARYQYEVKGMHYTGHRISLNSSTHSYSSRSSAESTLAQYPVGKVVTVYYNPEQPDKSLLQR
ncbi:MAG: DUF3592 domain-containing protein [Pseudomonas sp.]|uniref:DUF3592 domain-containing protein n=1 Tax=Pseudomonas sp. TaxID=306 RepID=UPI0033935AE1